MESGAFILFTIFGIVAVVAAFLYSQAQKEKRRLAWVALGSELGLTYAPGDRRLLDLPFTLLRAGDGQGIDHAISGAIDGVGVHLFEYWYYEETESMRTSPGTGMMTTHRDRTYQHFTCAVVDTDLDAPHISIDRENFLTRLADHVGMRDIEFESEEFNRAMNIKSQDRRFASYLIDARMMEHLLPLRPWRFELVGNLLLTSCSRVDPARATEALHAATAFRARIPRAATDTYGAAPR